MNRGSIKCLSRTRGGDPKDGVTFIDSVESFPHTRG